MYREKKAILIDDIRVLACNFQCLLILRMGCLSAAEVSQFRVGLNGIGARLKVTKNSLAKIALCDGPAKDLVDSFSGSTAVAYADEIVALSKLVFDFAKKGNKVSVVCGLYQEEILKSNDLLKISSMPSIDTLRMQIVTVLQHSVLSRLVGFCGMANANNLVNVLNNIKK